MFHESSQTQQGHDMILRVWIISHNRHMERRYGNESRSISTGPVHGRVHATLRHPSSMRSQVDGLALAAGVRVSGLPLSFIDRVRAGRAHPLAVSALPASDHGDGRHDPVSYTHL